MQTGNTSIFVLRPCLLKAGKFEMDYQNQPSLRPGLHAQHYSAYIVYFGLISHSYFIATNAV